MKGIMKKVTIILLSLIAVSCFSSKNNKKIFFDEIAKIMNEDSTKVDDFTSFYAADYNDKTNTFTYSYTITDSATAKKMSEEKQGFVMLQEPVIIGVINDQKNAFFLNVKKYKATVKYSYRTETGENILDIVVTPEKYNIK